MISFITPTHNPKYLRETYQSLLDQTNSAWEWVLVPNGGVDEAKIREALNASSDPLIPVNQKVRILQLPDALEGTGIGSIKKWAFSQGEGDYLAELDHDDLLVKTAVEEIEKAFKSSQADFVYSNSADFFPNGNGHWFPNWKENGWRYRDTTIDGKWYNECLSFAPSAAALSVIYYAPNHIRCWRKDFYTKVGGHNPAYKVCDDHELCVRTYLQGTMHHIDKLLYLYRMSEDNTFSKKLDEIRNLTFDLYVKNIEALILRESVLTGKPCYDLGGAFNCPKGWMSVDLEGGDITADLNKKWPFADNSVLAFRAHDFIEHLPDKQHVMKELHRCLIPGGWALIQVPSTDGRGAFMDPTHVSYWNECSFWYYTRPESAKYIRNDDCHFMDSRLFTFFPTAWHEENKIPYVKAELRKIGGNMDGVSGRRRFGV